jgi:hypothetical protein
MSMTRDEDATAVSPRARGLRCSTSQGGSETAPCVAHPVLTGCVGRLRVPVAISKVVTR